MTKQGESSEEKYRATGYERVEPKATYAPWSEDREFLRVNETIRDHTLVDRYRCYELWQLVAQAIKTPGDLLEVGVWRGGTGALIAAQAARYDRSRVVFLADTFTGVVKAGRRDRYYRGGEHANTSVEHVRRVLESFDLDNARILAGVFPDETAGRIDTGTGFCFCHVDVDVYQGASDVTEWVLPRLNPGGIIVYDDYGFYGCEGVTDFVNEISGTPGLVVVHNLNGHAVIVKAEGGSGD